jgi:hypothetical protein
MKKEIKAKAKPKVLPMVRINTRITQMQSKYIKLEAKRTKQTEGEIFRVIINFARDNKKI